jgi:ribosomal protein S18 acetylase RimI-like enzyme
VSLRAPTDGDFAAMLELMNAHQLAAFGEADVTEEELRLWLSAPSVDVGRDIRLLERDGRLVGYIDVDPNEERPPRWWCDLKIDPDSDADAIVRKLVGWLEQRVDEGVLRVWLGNDDARMVDAVRSLGFAPVRHSYRMEIDLAGDEREPEWPPSISVRTVTESDERLVYDLVEEVWRDASDPLDETFEEWQHWTTKSEAYDPSLWFLALDGDDVAGFSLCRQDPVDPNAGYVATLGVRRPWRRQGLGEALLLHSFRAFRSRGYGRATLGVDASSPTGATRLYERAGMRVYRDTVFLERPVRP